MVQNVRASERRGDAHRILSGTHNIEDVRKAADTLAEFGVVVDVEAYKIRFQL